ALSVLFLFWNPPVGGPLPAALLGALGVANLGMGVGLVCGVGWVNWVVAVGYFLVVIASGLNMALLTAAGPVNPGVCGGVIIATAIFLAAVKNLRLRKKIREAGLEP